MIYPYEKRLNVSEFALALKEEDPKVNLVTVRNRKFYVYHHYEGNLNDIENAVVLLCYPKGAFHQAKALRVLISTSVALSTQEILDTYTGK